MINIYTKLNFVYISNMKNLFVVLFSILLLTSCEVYEEPTYPTLSGEYVIDLVTVDDVSLTQYFSGDTLEINTEEFPIDTILVGTTKIKFSNDRIFFNPYLNQYEITQWVNEFFYVTRNYEYHGSGHFLVDMNGKTFIFDIVEDGLSNLVIKGNSFNKTITFNLTMVGP